MIIQKSMVQGKSKKKRDIEFVVTEPMGLMEFLLKYLTKKSRNNIKSLLTHKEVIVDGKPISKYDYMLKEGQKVTINFSGSRELAPKDELDIIYEDIDMIVINKPAGLLSVSTDKGNEITAYNMLMDYVKSKNVNNRIFVVHRLDRDTSGVLMIAKSEKIKYALQDNWDKLVSERGYMAVVEGQLNAKKGTVKSWLRETKTHLMYSSYTPNDGLEAITNYQVVKENEEYSMLDIRLETGRKNQIRVHMKDLGNNILGDKKYGSKADPLKRLGLHAHRLVLTHPFTREVMCFEAKLPKGFNSLFNK